MAGLLDYLSPPSTGNGGGGLLDYLTQPLYQSPLQRPYNKKEDNADFLAALNGNPYAGSMLGAPPVQAPVFPDYVPPPAKTVFDTGTGNNLGGFTFGPQGQAPQMAQAAPQAPPPMPPPVQVGQQPQGDVTSPPSSAPVNGQLPTAQQVAAPPQQNGPLPSALGGGGLSNYLQNLHNGGGLITSAMDNPQQQAARSTYNALVSAGAPQQEAIAASLNPTLFQQVAPQYFSKNQPIDAGTDPFTGRKSFVTYDAKNKTLIPLNEAGGASANSGVSGFLAPGVRAMDSSLVGDDYLKQFSPEVQAGVKARLSGDTMPTNSRSKGLVQAVDFVAKKYGADIGQRVDDTAYYAKKQMRTDLAKSTPNSAGGILANGASAMNHLAEASDKFAAHPNYNGPDMIGGAAVGHAGNIITNSTPAGSAWVAGANGNLLKYGQEGTKFYAGTGGGEGERMAALKGFDASKSSSLEQAAFLRNEKQLMLDRFRTKEDQVRDQLGQEYLDQHPVITKSVKDAVARIDANIAKLEGTNGAAAPSGGSNTTKTGVSWSIVR